MKTPKNNFTFLLNKKLILNLIKDDLKNTKLVSGLTELGLDSGKYYLNLGETIVSLMGLDDKQLDEKLWESYSDCISRVADADIFDSPEKLDFFAQAVYLHLLKARVELGREVV